MSKENREMLFSYFFAKTLKGLKNLSGVFVKKATKVVKYIVKKFAKQDDSDKEDEHLDEDIIVTSSGPLSNIYFTEKKDKITDEYLNGKYGKLFEKIVNHEGIEFGIIKTEQGYTLAGRNGMILLNDEFKIINAFGDVLRNIEYEEDIIIAAISEIALSEESGDIILFGGIIYDKTNSKAGTVVINFENQYGGHGGIGGMQTEPFLITKKLIYGRISVGDLYNVFRGRD